MPKRAFWFAFFFSFWTFGSVLSAHAVEGVTTQDETSWQWCCQEEAKREEKEDSAVADETSMEESTEAQGFGCAPAAKRTSDHESPYGKKAKAATKSESMLPRLFSSHAPCLD